MLTSNTKTTLRVDRKPLTVSSSRDRATGAAIAPAGPPLGVQLLVLHMYHIYYSQIWVYHY